MSSRHLSIRLDATTFDRLDAESRRIGENRSQLAKRLLEEGLRTAAHPGIVFRAGPAGRRPGLAGGPDVWEVIRVVKGLTAPEQDAIQETAELSGLTPSLVRAAVSYYAEYPEEIDAWLDRVDEEASRAAAAWRREQAILGS